MANVTGTRRSSETPFSEIEAATREFHETYEALAPHFAYETRERSAVPWADVPQENRLLMMAVVASLVLRGVIRLGGPPAKRIVGTKLVRMVSPFGTLDCPVPLDVDDAEAFTRRVVEFAAREWDRMHVDEAPHYTSDDDPPGA